MGKLNIVCTQSYKQTSSKGECDNLKNRVLQMILKHLMENNPELFKTGN